MGWLLIMVLCASGCDENPVDKFDTELECTRSAQRANLKEQGTETVFYCTSEEEKRV